MLPARLVLRISRPLTAWRPSPNSGEKAMNVRLAATARAGVLALMALLLCPATGSAQTTYAEDFTGATSNNQWFFYNGACLTAGTNTSTASPGYIPGCLTILSTYYNASLPALGKLNTDSYLTGGDLGFLGGSTAPGSISAQLPDLLPAANNPNWPRFCASRAMRSASAGLDVVMSTRIAPARARSTIPPGPR